MRKLRAAILGSGNIGTDLLIKLTRSANIKCVIMASRNFNSPGMRKASLLNVKTSDRGIEALLEEPSTYDIVFDATSAPAHIEHWNSLKKLGKHVIDLTPAKLGKMCIPPINAAECMTGGNVNMVTCGGQSAIPIAYALSRVHSDIEYIEIVSSIASRSAGPATRLNIDEYISTTEDALKQFTNVKHTKSILILNPAHPPIHMQTSIYAKIKNPDIQSLHREVKVMTEKVCSYVPGFQLILPPTLEGDKVMTTIRVDGLGDYLPTYAGNLDIISCAALELAELIAKREAKS